MTSEYMELVEDKITQEDSVNHPKHYNTDNPKIRVKCRCGEILEVPIECIDVIRDMPSWKGNAIKYLWRGGLKKEATLSLTQKTIEDLEKAVWYIQDEINTLLKLNYKELK